MKIVLHPEDVVWIINDLGELGIRIGDQCFFYSEGCSLCYTPKHDDGTPMLYRTVDGDFDFPRTHYHKGTIQSPIAQYWKSQADVPRDWRYTSGTLWEPLPDPAY